MQRWKITVLLGIFLGVLIISCAVLFLQNGNYSVFGKGENVIDRNSDLPLHPAHSKSQSRRSSSHLDSHQTEYQHRTNQVDDQNEKDDDEETVPRHNYRRRFSDAIKGVFKDLINSKNSSVDQTNHPQPNPQKESVENNSSRLKRQLDFGSASDETDGLDGLDGLRRTTKPVSSSTPISYTNPSTSGSRRPTIKFTTRRPIIKTLKVGGNKGSAEYAENSDENKIDNSAERRRNFKNAGTRNVGFKPKLKYVSSPSSKTRYDDVSTEDAGNDSNEGDLNNPKNFTYEVVQVERKVVRKEDGHIPAYFTKGSFNINIEPRLSKVERKEALNRPAVLYRKNWSPEQGPRPRRPISTRDKPEASESNTSSDENEKNNKKRDDSQEKKVVVNLHEHLQAPYNDKELSEEDLKDYHDGHSTFGSKEIKDGLRKRSGGTTTPHSSSSSNPYTPGDKQYVIEKGKVTERTLRNRDNSYESPEEVEIYSVPGGRSSSTETSKPNRVSFFNPAPGREPGARQDLTSPEVPSSFEELFRKGHPGVVRAPPNNYRSHNLAEPYGESADYGNPFPYNPLVDDPPLKFDPESDRFYGSPIPENKEKLAQSNSPAKVENEPSRERSQEYNGYFKPRGRSEDDDEENSSTQNSAEAPAPLPPPSSGNPDDRLYSGRIYNPPDYSTDYDTGANDQEKGKDSDIYDFVGLDENFERQNNDHDDGPPDDFFDFPGERGFGGFTRPRASPDRSTEVNSEEDHNNFHDRTTEVERKPPPPQPVDDQQPPRRNSNPDYDGNASASQENDYGGFGSSSGGRGTVNNGHSHTPSAGDEPEVYDSGFVETLKQFDEEIKKLQEEERKKLLQAAPLPSPQQSPSPISSTPSGYKKQPPLIITSPGPIENSQENTSPPSSHELGTTLGVTEDDVDDGPSVPSTSNENSGEEPTAATGMGQMDEGEDEEEDDNNNRSAGGTDSSEGRSEEDDEDKKKK